jgi:hypothetical protein
MGGCVLPFVDTMDETILGEDIHFPFLWEQGRLIHTGEGAGGIHVLLYGLIENRSEQRLNRVRFLLPGTVTFIKDISAKAWAPDAGPDEVHWKTRIIRKLSSQMTTISVRYPYPQGYTLLAGGPGSDSRIGTLKSHEIKKASPPSPLTEEDFDFKELFKKSDLIFSKNLVETKDKKLYIQLSQLETTEILCTVDMDPGENRFFACEFYSPERAIARGPDMCQWNAYGPQCFLSRLSTEVNRMAMTSQEFGTNADSILRYTQLINRVRSGMCSIGKFWVSVLFEGNYYSIENTHPLATYFHMGSPDKLEYQSKTWIFDAMDFYVVNTIFAMPRLKFESAQ